jgi:micrococcal nuclease
MRRTTAVAGLLSLAALAIAIVVARPAVWPASQDSSRAVHKPPHARSSFEATVKRVVDGDSIDLVDGRALRYVGIDCPEKGEPFADEATARNRELVQGKRIRVETDLESTDRYGRVLGYVVPEGASKTVNETLLEEGLAVFFLVPPNEAMKSELFAAQERARQAKRGIWSRPVARREAYYVGSSDRFHRPDCPHVKDISHPVRFGTREAALDSGRSPCRTCKP